MTLLIPPRPGPRTEPVPANSEDELLNEDIAARDGWMLVAGTVDFAGGIEAVLLGFPMAFNWYEEIDLESIIGRSKSES